MQKPKQPKRQRLQKPYSTERLEFINDDQNRLAIPVGPRFQAVIPDCIGPPHEVYPPGGDTDFNTSKWLGTKVWPRNVRDRATKGDSIGKGRPDSCPCAYPGSEECVKRHITDKKIQLQMDLGAAFWRWKFNEMGEEVSKLWTIQEQKKFDSLVKTNPMSQGKSFLKPALEGLPCQRRETIVSYYFNVYVPRRMSMKTRSGCSFIDTDDDEAGEAPYSKGSRKRCKANGIPSYVKTRYLTGRR